MDRLIRDEPENFRFRVNRRTLTDEAIFAEEMARIFDKCWLYLGHEAELGEPGEFRTRTVAGRRLIFMRDRQGEIGCFINACSHRGATICPNESGRARSFTCPYHGWTFDTGGNLMGLPDSAKYADGFDKAQLGLHRVRTESYRGFVFITFNPDPPSLTSYLGEMTSYLDLIPDQAQDPALGMEVLRGTQTYSARCNWKMVVENIGDGAHALVAHRRYLDMMIASGMDFSASTMMKDQYAHVMEGGHFVMQSSAGAWGRPSGEEEVVAQAERRRLLEERHGKAYADRLFAGPRALVMFPNFAVIDLIMGITIRVMQPVSPAFTSITQWQIAPRGEPAALRRQRLDNYLTFWGPAGMATPDDVAILESIQESFGGNRDDLWQDMSKGMNMDALSGQEELLLRHFWRRWAELVLDKAPAAEPHSIASDLPYTRSAATGAAGA